ncbi:MAG TPA: glutathione S-transferase [Rhizomicrobium sp.]|jgi:glutathione S-transferase|nr:glutathione S-transferase [Rhizomicrobium sp.]
MAARYKLFLGTKNWSSWSLRPWLALRATGAEFDETVIRLRQPDTRAKIRELTGCDTVPVLQINESGTVQTVFDSLAICETLAERHPGLWPASSAARAEARSISAAMHSGFGPLRATLPMEFARRLPMPEVGAEVSEDIERIRRFWRDALARYGGEGGFLFGTFSIAECMYAPVVSRFRTYDIPLEAALQAWCDRVFALPAMQEWLAASEAEVAAGLS